MATDGPRFPGTAASLANAGTSENAEAWVTPANIVSDNASEAAITAATYDSPDISQLLVASNFGFAIPAGATIDGIVVEVERRSIIASSGKDFRVQLAKGTAFANLVGSNKAVPATIWPSTVGIASYGGAADLWGATWTDAEVNASSFAVMLSCQANIANADVGVDFIRVTVHYTAATGKTGSETVASSDASVQAAALTPAETVASSDASLQTAAAAVADTGGGTDASLEVAAAVVGDTGAGTDAAIVEVLEAKTGSDTGGGTDAAVVTAAAAPTDVGASVDASAVTAALAPADTATTTDAATGTSALTAADTGAGTDAIGSRDIVSGDVAGSTDSATAVGGDQKSASDQATSSDSSALSAAGVAADTATSSDAAIVTAMLEVSQIAAGADTAALASHYAANDVATGTDSSIRTEPGAAVAPGGIEVVAGPVVAHLDDVPAGDVGTAESTPGLRIRQGGSGRVEVR